MTYSKNQANVLLSGTGNDPLEPKIGGINWAALIVINDSNSSAPTADVQYDHTCYPAFNVRVNGTQIYDSQLIGYPQQNRTDYLLRCLTSPAPGSYPHVTGQTTPIVVPQQQER